MIKPTTKLDSPTPINVDAKVAKDSQRYKIKAPSRGGARPGAGRPKGSSNKITMDNILQNLDQQLGRSYAEQIAMNYMSAIQRGDYAGIRDYDRVLLGKVIADRQHIETVESEDTTIQKAEAFADALRNLSQTTSTSKGTAL